MTDLLMKKKSGINSECLSNAIYTCITRAMYFLQVFVPEETVRGNCEPIKNLIEVMKSSFENNGKYQKEQNVSNNNLNENKEFKRKIVVVHMKKKITPQ